MTYYKIRYSATVYGEEAGSEEQLEEDIESSFEEVLYQIFHGDAYNVECEVKRRLGE